MPRRDRTETVTIHCPYRESPDADPCEQPITVTMSPYVPGTRWDPPEGPDIEDLSGTCRHVDLPEAGEMLYDAAVEALAEADGAARDRYYDQKLHMQLEGDD